MFKNKKKIKSKIGTSIKNKLNHITLVRVKNILLISILAMMVLAGYRAFSVNAIYDSNKENVKTLTKNVERYNDFTLSQMIENGERLALYQIKVDTNILEKKLIENHGEEKLQDVLVNGNFDPEVYNTFQSVMDNHFATTNDDDKLVIIGTEDGILLVDDTSGLTKFDKIKGDDPMITWEEFYQAMDNPTVTRKAFEGLKSGNAMHPVILRTDGKYKDDRYYTTNDLIEEYKKNGVKAFNGYVYLTGAAITEDGDIFGNKDTTYMQNNDNVKKIYVFVSDPVTNIISDGLKELTEMNIHSTSDISIAYASQNKDLLNATVNLFLNIGIVIGLLIAYKTLSDLQDDIEESLIKEDSDIDEKSME